MLARLRPLGARVLRDYEAYWIFRVDPVQGPQDEAETAIVVSEVGLPQLHALSSALLREQAWYGGEGAHAFVATHADEPAGMCAYWHGERYRRRNFWPLRQGEAKLVQVIVEPAHRGRGVASRLIRASAAALGMRGFTALYARVWHSNAPSIAAFRRAGWHRIALVVTGQPPGLPRRIRLVLPWRDA